MTTAEAIQNARNALVSRGWCQGSMASRDGSLCLVGAVVVGIYGYLELASISEQETDVWRAITETLGTSRCSEWNDDPARTVGDVLALLDAATAKAVTK